MQIDLGSSQSAQISPDLAGTHLLGTSQHSAAVIIDWRNLTQLQTLPAHEKGHVHKVGVDRHHDVHHHHIHDEFVDRWTGNRAATRVLAYQATTAL